MLYNINSVLTVVEIRQYTMSHACLSSRSVQALHQCHLWPTGPPSIIQVVCVEALKLVQAVYSGVIGTDNGHACAYQRFGAG